MQLTRKHISSGSTLIEVLIAMVILTVLVLGVASFIQYGRSSVYAQRDRIAVLERVNGRLEELRAEPYTTFTDTLPLDYNEYWMRKEQGEWTFYSSRSRQTLLVNQARRYRVTTTVRYVDADGGTPSYDMLKFTVGMRYRTGAADEIVLSTYRAR